MLPSRNHVLNEVVVVVFLEKKEDRITIGSTANIEKK